MSRCHPMYNSIATNASNSNASTATIVSLSVSNYTVSVFVVDVMLNGKKIFIHSFISPFYTVGPSTK